MQHDGLFYIPAQMQGLSRNAKPFAVWCGRPTPVGNPYRVGKDGTREHVVNVLYRRWLFDQIQARDSATISFLRGLRQRCRDNGNILYVCCACRPEFELCHTIVLARCLCWLERTDSPSH